MHIWFLLNPWILLLTGSMRHRSRRGFPSCIILLILVSSRVLSSSRLCHSRQMVNWCCYYPWPDAHPIVWHCLMGYRPVSFLWGAVSIGLGWVKCCRVSRGSFVPILSWLSLLCSQTNDPLSFVKWPSVLCYRVMKCLFPCSGIFHASIVFVSYMP